ncbi:MAG: nucleotidyl transferase AbiEii/AbiGii toxin family protein [bacterium]
MRTDILSTKQVVILELLNKMEFVTDFYLAGGTALALQYGHRESVDFDFFAENPFSTDAIFRELSKNEPITLNFKSETTLGVLIKGVTCTFFLYQYPILERFVNFSPQIKLTAIPDLAAMKVAAISDRGKKRDFIDLYFICQTDHSLKEVVEFYQKKYEVFNQDLYHIYKSLIYFDDAEPDSIPVMYEETDWDEIKSYFIKEVTKLME